jgi:hypothetical protein
MPSLQKKNGIPVSTGYFLATVTASQAVKSPTTNLTVDLLGTEQKNPQVRSSPTLNYEMPLMRAFHQFANNKIISRIFQLLDREPLPLAMVDVFAVLQFTPVDQSAAPHCRPLDAALVLRHPHIPSSDAPNSVPRKFESYRFERTLQCFGMSLSQLMLDSIFAVNKRDAPCINLFVANDYRLIQADELQLHIDPALLGHPIYFFSAAVRNRQCFDPQQQQFVDYDRCREALVDQDQFLDLPTSLCAIAADYDLGLTPLPELAATWRYDWSLLFPPAERSDIAALLQLSPLSARQQAPHLWRDIFKQLQATLSAWPPLPHNLKRLCDLNIPSMRFPSQHDSRLDEMFGNQ